MSETIYKFSHEAMTTSFDALIVHPDRKYAGQAAAAVFAEVSRLERLLSRFDPGTDLSQANRLRPGQFMVVNLEIVECLELAARAYQVTNGAFDVAYRSRQGGKRPSAMDYLLLSRPTAEELSQGPADFLVGFAPEAEEHGFGRDMEVPLPARMMDSEKTADPTPPDGLNLDLGGLGKGYALDKSLQILDDWEIDNALLNAGTSTVLARGAGPDGQGWPVGVSGQYGSETGIDKTVLVNEALSGSGTAVKGAHIRTPESGAAAPAIAAWVKAGSAAWTDALSTAMMVLSRETSEAMMQKDLESAGIVLYPAEFPLVIGHWSGIQPDSGLRTK